MYTGEEQHMMMFSRTTHSIHAGSINTKCPARHVATVQENGTIEVKFYGHHNHKCQEQCCVNFVNPIEVCDRLRYLVDVKLIAGVTDCGKIQRSIQNEIVQIGQRKDDADHDLEK